MGEILDPFDPHRGNNNNDDDDYRNTSTAGIMRSPTRSSTASISPVDHGEEPSYDHISTGRPIRLNAPITMDVPQRTVAPPADGALVKRLFSPAAHRDQKRGIKYVSGPDLVGWNGTNVILTDL